MAQKYRGHEEHLQHDESHLPRMRAAESERCRQDQAEAPLTLRSPPGDIHEHPKLSNPQRIFTSLTAGALAGALAKTTIAPLDRTKIYFQTHPEKRYRFKGALKFLRITYANDGFLSLWRGNSATMARIIPYAAIQFMAHEQYKRLFGISHADQHKGSTKPDLRNFLAGSLAGLTGQTLTYPLDRARAVMAVTKVGRFRNLRHVFSDIRNKEGSRALFVGITPTMIGVLLYAGTSFFVYETLKYLWMEKKQSQSANLEDPSLSPIQRLICGAIAGLLGQTSSYPLDIVRRRMQTARQMGVCSSKYTSIIGTMILVYNREGIFRGWYKGISMNFIKGPIATGISFTTFDYIQLGLRKILLIN